MNNPEPRWADIKAVREYLGISRDTLWRYTRDGVITRHTLGTTVRYDLNQVDAVLRSTATPGGVAADVIARIRAALPPDVPGAKPLIQIARVHAAIDKVAAELGVNP